MRELLQMGGYGIYVWGSYGLVAVILLYQYCASFLKEKKTLRALAEAANDSDAAP